MFLRSACPRVPVGVFAVCAMVLAIAAPSSLAQAPSPEWRTLGSLRHSRGTASARVKVTERGAKSIELTYAMPGATARTLEAGTSRILVGDAPHTGEPGRPRLPVIPARILVPAGCEVDQVHVVTGRKTVLEGKYDVEYAETPIPLVPNAKVKPAERDPAVYGSDKAYPASPFTVVGVHKKRGASILFVNLHPVEYRPASGEVSSYETLRLRVTFRPAKAAGKVKYRQGGAAALAEGVDNPDEAGTYEAADEGEPAPLGCDPSGHYEYVVITSEAMKNATTDPSLTNLVAHRQARGVSATIVTVESIYTNYTGVDNAEKVRNFILDAYNHWETEYVLLGGDTGVVPMRKLWCIASGESDHIPSDVYFQCLDGNYNYDGDAYWGETTDGDAGGDVDLLAEVYVGRASAETPAEMANFVYKTLLYENDPESADYLRRALMCGEYLGFGGISQYATASMEEIRWGANTNGYATEGFASCELFEVGTLYDSETYSWTKSNLVEIVNSGTYSIINHLGHANYNYVMKFYNADADAMTNRNPCFAYSQGCIPGNFEADCVAEHLTTSTRCGMYAVVFNSRYGWGRYSSTDGPSQRFDRQFWDAYFAEDIIELGALNADSHEDNLYDINGSCIRWCFYESNLLGDPLTPMRGQFLTDALAVTPSSPFAATGAAGGPFAPASKTYSLFNTSTNLALSWRASCASNWIGVSPTGGTVAAGVHTSFVVSVNANAHSLGENRYAATLVFTNRTNGKGSTTRAIDLLVNNPPRVTNSSIQAGDILPAGNLAYTARFNDRMKNATLDAADFALRGQVTGAWTPSSWSYNTNTSTLAISYTNLPEDDYTLTLYSGDGRFEDIEGLSLDGEATAWPIPPNASGNGVEGGDFVATFSLDATNVAYPVPLAAKKPAGSLIYDPAVAAYIRPTNDVDRFTLSLDTNQTLTVLVDPVDASLRPRAALSRPGAAGWAGATGTAAGACALVQTMRIASPGSCTVEVAGVAGTTGGYAVQVVLNAALENELYLGSSNNSPAAAQDLSNSFVTLAGPAARGAVLGRGDGSGYDYYAFDTVAGDLLTLAVTSLKSESPAVALCDAGGSVVASGRSGFENVSQAVDGYRSVAGGRCYARVSGATGDYSLVVLRNAGFDLEANGSLGNAQDITTNGFLLGAVSAGAAPITVETEPNDDGLVGGSTNDLPFANDWSGSFAILTGNTYRAQVEGEIRLGSDGDWDFFRVYAGPGDAMNITLTRTTISDPYLRLYDRSGIQIAYDDDSGGALNSLLNFSNFTYRGEYYIVADSYGVSTGTYVLACSHTTLVPPVRTDEDYVKLTAAAGDELVIQTGTPGDGTNEFVNLLDPALSLYGPGGGWLAGDDNGAPDGRNALVRYTVATAGVYSVGVRASRGAGEYTVGLPRKIGPLQVLFRAPDSMVREDAGSVVLPVILSEPATSQVRVSYSVAAGGTATSGSDFSLAAGTLTFPPGQTATGITLTVLNDTLSEGTETVLVRLSSPSNAVLGEYGTNRCVIVDDEMPLRLQFAAARFTAAESGTQAVLSVVRTGGRDGRVTLDYATRDGDALGGEDYAAVAGTLVLTNGATNGTIVVPVELDTLDEIDESFNVLLANPGGGAILGAPGTATVTILDFKMPRTNGLANAGFEQGQWNGWLTAGQVGCAAWAAQSGTGGIYVAGWNGYSYGAISQRLSATRGTYTFALWAKREEGYNARETFLRLEWLDAAGNQIRAATVADYTALPGDGLWHHLRVTGKCTNANMAAVRGVFYSGFDIQLSGHCSLMVDNASLYPGVYTGACALADGGFETGLSGGDSWRGTPWGATPDRIGNGREGWAGRSGWGAALYGWDPTSNQYTSLISQNMVPGPGTYTFSIWFKREANFLPSAIDLRLQWYDATFAIPVQADTVCPVPAPPDNAWHQYFVTGTCTDTNLVEVRATVRAEYLCNYTATELMAFMIDDALFYKGTMDTDQDRLPDDWETTYFTNATAALPEQDGDRDGMNNYQEYMADTIPTQCSSCFGLDIEGDEGGNELLFPASPDRVYTLQYATNLLPAPSWRNIWVGEPGSRCTMCLDHVVGATNGYYRVKVDLP